MNVEVFVHGVPNGESFWGKEEERNFFGTFYGQGSDDAVKFLIQTRSINGTTYCYYSYLVYKNVLGNEGREGSYFGLSIRFDAYCKNFLSIYKVLDTIFTAYVLNKILKYQNGKYKYAITDFGSSSEIMGNINSAILQLIQSSLTNDSFGSLRGFATGGANLPTGNLYEANVNEVESYIKQYGKIALSPYYPTARETGLTQQYDSKLQVVKQQYEEKYKAEIDAKDQKICSLNDSLVSLQNENGNLRETIVQKEQAITQRDLSITDLKNKIKQIEHTKKVIRNVELIKDPIIELSKIFGEQRTHTYNKTDMPPKGKTFTIKSLIPLVNLILLLFVVAILFAKGSIKETEPNNEVACLQDTIRQLKERIEDFQVQEVSGSSSNPKLTNPFSSSNTTELKLDVHGYNEGGGILLNKGQSYMVEVKNSQDSGNGKWEIEGGHIVGETTGQCITFIPEANEKVKITYQSSNSEYKVRELKVNP